jgi:guanosine-diphosphatase
MMESFPTGNIMLLSYFYDRIAPFLEVSQGTSSSFSIKWIAELAEIVCQGMDAWHAHFAHNKEAMDELRERPEYCLDLTFMYTLLRLGYEFDDNRPVMVAKQIDSTELGWALGAGIALVGAHLECVA